MDRMHKDRLHSALRVILSLIVVTIAFVLTLALAQNLRKIGVFWPFSASTGMVWFVCSVIVFVIAVLLLRLTKFSWFWSLVSGASVVVVYSIAVSLVLQLLFAMLAGLIQD